MIGIKSLFDSYIWRIAERAERRETEAGGRRTGGPFLLTFQGNSKTIARRESETVRHKKKEFICLRSGKERLKG